MAFLAMTAFDYFPSWAIVIIVGGFVTSMNRRASRPRLERKQCPRCGGVFPAAANFCGQCGQAFARDADAIRRDARRFAHDQRREARRRHGWVAGGRYA